MGLTN